MNTEKPIMKKAVSRLFLAVFVLAFALTGCGGGGGTGGAGTGGAGTGGAGTGGAGTGWTGGFPSITYTIGGTLTGLAAGQSIVLQDNGGDNLTIGANGTFTFATALAASATYNVTVLSQPANGQVCNVTSGGSGTVSNASVTSVSVNCSSTVGGYLVGLAAGQSVVLQNNGGDYLTVGANGAFTFATPVLNYNVTVFTQPANGQVCAVEKNNTASGSSGIGTVSGPVNTVRISCASIFTFAGSAAVGDGDALGEDAVFSRPSGMAMDAAGNFYVADAGDNVIRKITPAGLVTTLAGSGVAGYADGTGAAAQFNFLQINVEFAGIAVDGSGNVYVADNGNNAIRKITPAGVVTTLAGQTLAGYADGTGAAAQFNSPRGVTVDSLGNVYVGDTGNNMIRKITPAGLVSTFAGGLVAGNVNGTGGAALFCSPEGLALDSTGNIYVADTCNSAIRKVTPNAVVSTMAGGTGAGYFDATGATALFSNPEGVAVDASGNVYVSDFGNTLIRMITPAGVVSTLAGGVFSPTTTLAFSDGPVTTAKFYWPQGVAVDASGNVYFSDASHNRVRKISAMPYSYTVGGHVMGLASGSTVVLQNNAGNNLTINANGLFTFATPLSTAQAYNVTVATQPAGPTCVVVNGTGGFTTGDVLTINVNCALVSTYAGSGTAGLTNAATALASTFNKPSGVAIDATGNLYVADISNLVIRKITPAGVVTTLAGSGTYGYVDATGTAASFSFSGPTGIAVDAAGNVYVGDTGNRVIRKITSAGVVSTLAGAGPMFVGFADGTGTAAMLYSPRGLALDAAGNLYVADDGNNSIRKVTTAGGVVTTLAGGGGFSNWGYVNGIGTAARFTNPRGVAVDSAGNVYVADTGNAAVRKITPAGLVTTLAGHSGAGWMGTGYLDSTGTGALFYGPNSIAVDAAGNVYVTDLTVRMINPTGTVTTLAGVPGAPVTSGYLDGNGASALFNFGCNTASNAGIAVDAGGNLYVGDDCNNRIRKITP